MKTTIIPLIALTTGVLAAGKCGTQTCSKSTPCCVQGLCNRSSQYCMPINCEPANSYSPQSCWNTPHCIDHRVSFKDNTSFANIKDYHGHPSNAAFVSMFEPSNARLKDHQLELQLTQQASKGFGATVTSTRAIQYGTVVAQARSACKSGGVVSSFIIRNDQTGDEIDFEWVGKDPTRVQSNYYWKNQLDYTKMIPSPQMQDTTVDFHSYKVDWSPDRIQWSIDNRVFRTVKRSDTWDPKAKAFKYPDTEAYVSFSVWDGGSGAKGTADWAGGKIQWDKGPFVMAVKSVDIKCFYKGNETTYIPPK